MIGAAQGWGESELRRFLPASLRDTARNWLARDPSRLKKPWDTIKLELLEKFRPKGTTEHYTRALYQRKFKPGETINEYYNAIVLLYDILESLGKDFSDQEMTDKLISGLKGQLREKTTFMKPTTPDEFLVEIQKVITNMAADGKIKAVGQGLMMNDRDLFLVDE